MNDVLRQLRRAVLLAEPESISDEQLLTAFLLQREEAAFEAMLRRHGPMVFGVCRRILGNCHDAEDAFQATFLVLARKAGSIRAQPVLASWLYGVAFRTAMKARTMSRKRREKERQARTKPSVQGDSEELLAQLDAELSRLPEKYRLPVVLCELEGHSRKEAARLLDLPEGTLSWRLAHARKLLARRLSRYGAVAVAALLSEGAGSARPTQALLKATTNAVLGAATIPVQVSTLTQGVLKAMLLAKLKMTFCAATLMLLTGLGATALTYRATAQQPGESRPTASHDGTTSATRPAADDLDSLRLEMEALRRELRATRERVKALEQEVSVLKVHGQQASPPRGRMSGPGGVTSSSARAQPGASSSVTEARPQPGSGTPALERGGKGSGGDRDLEPQPRFRDGQTTTSRPENPTMAADPLAEAEAALKKLRRDPRDTQAAEDLERALKQLKRNERAKHADPYLRR